MEAMFEIFKDRAGQYRFHLIAPNGEIIAPSEGYITKQTCLDGIVALRRHIALAKINDLTFPRPGR